MSDSLFPDSLISKFARYPRDLKNLWIWKTGFCRRLRANDPVFVYQMGKVASRGVQEPLQTYWPGEVIHGHRFDADYPQGEVQELFRYWHSQHPPERMPLISLTRDPVDRNVSAFFQNFELYTGIAPAQCTQSPEELLDCFLKRFPHDIPLVWFDEKIKKEFGVDVYSQPFPQEGVVVIDHPRTPLLVMRIETTDEVKNKAVREFLNLPDFSVERRNDPGEKAYGEIYRRFKTEVRLPAEYIQRMTDSKYYRHFYGEDFLEETRRKWQA